jgi:hypothetical protein
MIKAARYYMKLGYKIFPLVVRDKLPATKHGYKSIFELSDAEILSYWERNPDFNIGLPTGSVNGIFVFDIDGEDGKRSLYTLEKEYGILPRTATSLTSEGKHMLFKFQEGLRNRARVMPGLDIRADGGYIVVPPSIHPSGKKYRWLYSITTTSIAQAPEWLIKKITYRDPVLSLERKLNGSYHPGTGPILKGERNDRLYRMAFAAAMAGKDYQEVLAEIVEANNQRCTEMLTLREVETLVGSAFKGARGV